LLVCFCVCVCLFFFSFARLFVYLFASLFACLLVCLFTCLLVRLLACVIACLMCGALPPTLKDPTQYWCIDIRVRRIKEHGTLFLPISRCAHSPTCLFACLLVCLFTCLLVRLLACVIACLICGALPPTLKDPTQYWCISIRVRRIKDYCTPFLLICRCALSPIDCVTPHCNRMDDINAVLRQCGMYARATLSVTGEHVRSTAG